MQSIEQNRNRKESLLRVNQLKYEKLFPLATVWICAGIVALRAPNLLTYPRFWAEEGSFYFSFTYTHHFLQSLLFVDWRAGYLNAIASISAGVAAHLSSLESAPAVTLIASFIVQIIPFTIIAYGRSKAFRGIAKKLVACGIFLFAPHVIGEVWLNTINSQIYFDLIAILILIEDLERASALKRWAYRILLAFGGLSGVYVIFFAADLYRRSFFRTKQRAILPDYHCYRSIVSSIDVFLDIGFCAQ
jgi:hypothetical protein